MTLTFEHHGAASAESILTTVITPLYEASHRDLLSNPFYSGERFAERVRGYVRAPGFALVVAYIDGQVVGQAFGYALPERPLVAGTDHPRRGGIHPRNRHATFAFNELMAVPEWQGKGIAHATHDELLRVRPEERATLLVREDNDAAQAAYLRWGWEKIGKLRPYRDAPHFDAMVLPCRWRPPLLVARAAGKAERAALPASTAQCAPAGSFPTPSGRALTPCRSGRPPRA